MVNNIGKAYHETWVQNIHNQDIIKNWFDQNYINPDQYESAKKQFPVGFRPSNIFVKIGLFIFTNILISSLAGLASIFLATLFDSKYMFSILCLIYSGILFTVLENLIKKNNFYYSGVDNALLYAALSLIFAFFVIITDSDLPFWANCLALIIILGVATIRYADSLVTICLFGTCVAFMFSILSKFPIGKQILPFAIMVISALGYIAITKWKKIHLQEYYFNSQNILEILILFTFYLGGNYYVVREGNAALNKLSESIQISFAPLFYFFTFIIPAIYLYLGIRKRDRKLLVVSLISIAFSIFTYREYFSIMPTEWALTIGGLILVIFSIVAIRYLRTPKKGITYIPDSENKFQNLESVLVSQITPNNPTPSGPKFGGGDFGGAGGGGSY